LVSLLLFGKAHLSRPTWLHGLDFPELDRFEKEDLVEWMPEDVYEHSYEYLGILILRLLQKAYVTDKFETISLEVLNDKRSGREYKKFLLEREIRESDISHDISTMIEKLFYLSPLVGSNLKHLGIRGAHPEELLLWPTLCGTPLLIPFDGQPPPEFYEEHPEYREFREMEAKENRGSFLSRLADLESHPFYEDLYDELYGESDDDTFDQEELHSFHNEFARVLDAGASSLAAEMFSARTGLPFKTSGNVGPSGRVKAILGPEAYQLLKIQFHDLRYPVVQTIDDVLRLREDRHLITYRSVIEEYSARLRTELESERTQVIQEFRKDMQSALKSLNAVKRWSKIVDMTFYLSLPLAIIGTLAGLPLSDILTIPLTTYAKMVSRQRRNELDWILFGRSGE